MDMEGVQIERLRTFQIRKGHVKVDLKVEGIPSRAICLFDSKLSCPTPFVTCLQVKISPRAVLAPPKPNIRHMDGV